jgi:hypothetical protein
MSDHTIQQQASEKETPMAKYDRDGSSASHRAERAATDKVLNQGDKSEFRRFCDESAKDSDSKRDDK